MNEFEELDRTFLELLRPNNFIQLFESKESFKDWCGEGTVEDLKIMLKEYEKYELYEYCAIIRDVVSSLMRLLEYDNGLQINKLKD